MAKGQKKDLNTACRATFKDGTTKDFNSMEEASQETGVSIAAIKIRCNKPGGSGKDGIKFEWLDDYTARYYRAKKSKNKGKDLEYEIVERLKNIGYENVCRSGGTPKK